MDQQPLRGGLPSTPKSWVVNLSAQRTLSLALIVDCDSLLRLCSLGRNHLYTGASPKDGVAAFKLKFMRFFQVLLLLLLEHPDPRSPRLGPQRPPPAPRHRSSTGSFLRSRSSGPLGKPRLKGKVAAVYLYFRCSKGIDFRAFILVVAIHRGGFASPEQLAGGDKVAQI